MPSEAHWPPGPGTDLVMPISAMKYQPKYIQPEIGQIYAKDFQGVSRILGQSPKKIREFSINEFREEERSYDYRPDKKCIVILWGE